MVRSLRSGFRRRESALDVYNLALGLFLFVSPWLFSFVRESARLDAFATGALITALSIAAIIAFVEWEEWITLVLGLWMLASPWLLGFLHTPAMHVSLFVGAAVTFLALLELWLIHYPPDEGHSRTY